MATMSSRAAVAERMPHPDGRTGRAQTLSRRRAARGA
jgi:hypothetical protein